MKTKIIESSMNESKKYIICIHRKNMPYGEYEQFIDKRYKSFQHDASRNPTVFRPWEEYEQLK